MSYYLSGRKDKVTITRGIIAYDRKHIAIRNLKITGFHTGILFADTTISIANNSLLPNRALPNDTVNKFAKSEDIVVESVTISGARL